MKHIITTVLLMFALAASAQNYTVKGIAVDAKGNALAGAAVKTDKSKASVWTDGNGAYAIPIARRDTKIFLFLNEKAVMEKDVSVEWAEKPVIFKVEDLRPLNGYLAKDMITYYVGKNDTDMGMLLNNIGGLMYRDDEVYDNIRRKKITECMYDGRWVRFSAVNPSEVYMVKLLKPGSGEQIKYGKNNNEECILFYSMANKTDEINERITQRKADYKNDDTLRGVVTDTWGRPVEGFKIKTKTGATCVSDSAGRYAVKLNNKDKYVKADVDYTEGTTIRITKTNKHFPVNFSVMLHKNEQNGWWSGDLKTYYPGEYERMESIIPRFPGVRYDKDKGLVYILKFNRASRDGSYAPCNYYEVDGAPIDNLESLPLNTIHSIKIIQDGTENIYGGKGQFGAVIIQTKGMVPPPVPLTDWKEVKPKKVPGVEGMRMFIENQGDGIFYKDGKVIIDGKECMLYIVNSTEVDNLLSLESNMIDEIIIVRTSGVSVYGEKAKNGVVLISASKKDKLSPEENADTLTVKDVKKDKK